MKLQLWCRKDTGDLLLATPWFEILEKDEVVNGKSEILGDADPHPKRQFKFGMLTQVGWLIQNQYECWFGVGFNAEENFEVIDEEFLKC